MIDHHELRRLAGPLKVVETIALLAQTSSTNAIGRRVINECIDNELVVPASLIIAEEQSAGRGRGANRWASPRGGIYATLLQSRSREHMAVLPMEIAVIVARYLRSIYRIEARIKWPNDIVVNGIKLAGILIEARSSEETVYLIIGIGINVLPVEVDGAATTSIAEAAGRPIALDDAIMHFVQSVDDSLFSSPSDDETMAKWREWSVHRSGDVITARVGERTINGTWDGIDEHGHARIVQNDGTTMVIASGEIVQHS